MTLSVAIITLNEEANLRRTLPSLKFADEVVVVDSGSTDKTVELARSFGAKVYEEPWKGYAGQKNSAIAKCTGDWILSLDADEEVSADLAEQLRILLPSNPPHDAYYLPRRNIIFGRWIKHGGFYPDSKLRLFRRGAASFGARLVHETISFAGESDELEGALIHYPYPTIEDFVDHMNRYSSLGAEMLVEKGVVSRNYLAFVWNTVLRPLLQFVWNFFFRLGFLDGREGLMLHLYHAAYASWKYAKAWEKRRS
ncbi:glycosyltransferase family 2 protein [Terriglobus tenax]|uniref:glycosyltransferase family 2 protein n=1 Tax=Terriglobus tenax TaxID=1111115 RepID=UPI0021DF8D3C|nr:glycosyltransferase family 2 protein [Terriglobus tenax]